MFVTISFLFHFSFEFVLVNEWFIFHSSLLIYQKVHIKERITDRDTHDAAYGDVVTGGSGHNV